MLSMTPTFPESLQCCYHIVQGLNVYLHASASCKRWTQSNTTHFCRILEELASPASLSASIPLSLCGHRQRQENPKPCRIAAVHRHCVGPVEEKAKNETTTETNTPQEAKCPHMFFTLTPSSGKSSALDIRSGLISFFFSRRCGLGSVGGQ